MKILIAASAPPYENELEQALCKKTKLLLQEYGHDVDDILLPFSGDNYSLLQQMLAYRMFELVNVTDCLITIGYPSFALRCARKISFITALSDSYHQHYDTVYGALLTPQNARRIENTRLALLRAEKDYLSEAEKVFCASAALREEVRLSLSLPCETFSSEIDLPEGDKAPPGQAPYFLVQSSLAPSDRMELLLDAVTLCQHPFQVRIYVPQSEKMYQKALSDSISLRNLQDRICVVDASASTQDIAGARAVLSTSFLRMSPSSVLYMARSLRVPTLCTEDAGADTEVFSRRRSTAFCAAEAAPIAKALDDLARKAPRIKRSKAAALSPLSSILQEVVS